jgi:polyketide cyclase/dehydrase/lipid transport protein
MSTSYTATTFVEADPDRVFEYVRVPENQPFWAINFVRSTRPLSDGRYAMQTPAGELIYRIEEAPRCRTVDFVYETPEGETTMILPTRVVPHGGGSVFIFTVHRQPGMGDIEWEEGQRGLDEELSELKKLLET